MAVRASWQARSRRASLRGSPRVRASERENEKWTRDDLKALLAHFGQSDYIARACRWMRRAHACVCTYTLYIYCAALFALLALFAYWHLKRISLIPERKRETEQTALLVRCARLRVLLLRGCVCELRTGVEQHDGAGYKVRLVLCTPTKAVRFSSYKCLNWIFFRYDYVCYVEILVHIVHMLSLFLNDRILDTSFGYN